MSLFGIFALILLPILGGFIAWAGDVIGYRLGKSRRSLFGLRPRSTARLVGIAVGVALPLAGLGTALAGSGYAREAIFKLDQIMTEQKKAQEQIRKLDAQVAQASQDAVQAEKQVHGLQLQVIDKEQQTRAAQARLQQMRTQVDGLRRTTDTLRRGADVLRRSADALRRTADALRRTKQSLDQQITKLKQQTTKLQQNYRKVTADLATRTAELLKREEDLTKLEAEIKAAEATDRYQRAVMAGPVTFDPGHELVRAIVKVEDTQEAMERTLKALLLPASEAALEQGVAAGPDGLAVAPVRPLPPNQPAGETPSAEQIVTAIASQLRSGGHEKIVVGLRVWRRVFQGERAPALVEYWAQPYELVFPSGQTIATVVIDGSGTRVDVFNQLWNLVTKLVRHEAQVKGLLPHPETGEYGQLPSSELLEALDAISARKRPVTVDVKATRDTYTTDSLSIRIEVRGDSQARRPLHRG